MKSKKIETPVELQRSGDVDLLIDAHGRWIPLTQAVDFINNHAATLEGVDEMRRGGASDWSELREWLTKMMNGYQSSASNPTVSPETMHWFTGKQSFASEVLFKLYEMEQAKPAQPKADAKADRERIRLEAEKLVAKHLGRPANVPFNDTAVEHFHDFADAITDFALAQLTKPSDAGLAHDSWRYIETADDKP